MAEPYKARFPAGTRVRVADLAQLERFRVDWRFHHRLAPEQLGFAAREATVQDVSYYHGGDPLYTLDGVPGTWHEECLAELVAGPRPNHDL